MQHIICNYVLVDNEKYKTALEPELRFFFSEISLC